MGTAKKLCQRNQHHCDLGASEEAKQTVLIHIFKSSFDNKLAAEDISAKECLSAYGYGMWCKSVVQSERLQSTPDPETYCFYVWPVNETFDNDLHIILPIGKRCTCSHRTDYDVQCKHELKVDPRLELEDWPHRWLIRKHFKNTSP